MRELITGPVIANAARMLRDNTGHATIVLVEDGSSATYLRNHALDSHVVSIVVTHGKDNLYGALALLQTDHYIVGIADADHERLLGRIRPPNCLWFDHRDLETFLMSSAALDRFLSEFCPQLDAKVVREQVLSAAEAVGAWRLANARQAAGVSFQDLDIAEHMHNEHLEIDSVSLQSWICARNGEKAEKMVPYVVSHPERLEYVRGHDATCLLAIYVERHCGIRQTVKETERLLRLAASSEDLHRTSFWADATAWEDRTGHVMLAS